MKAHLMFKDGDLDLTGKLSWNSDALIQDLGLEPLIDTMSCGDKLLVQVSKSVLLSELPIDPSTIRYRQDILRDCLKHPDIIRKLYTHISDLIESEKRRLWGFTSKHPEILLSSKLRLMEPLLTGLSGLREIADESSGKFESEGLKTLFGMVQAELDEKYVREVQERLEELKFSDGVSISAELGTGNKATNYTLRINPHRGKNRVSRMFEKRNPRYSFTLPPRDDSGAQFLADIKNQGVNLVANALAQSSDHILSFLTMLRDEIAFYTACINLHEKLTEIGEETVFPDPSPSSERVLNFEELYDVSLALTMGRKVVGNSMNADGKDLILITGANKGGKSTFLRSIGIGQLMMQSGMFAPARSFSANISNLLFTHSKREEDSTMKQGKFDEEMGRMSDIVDHITHNSMILFNESFAATNEREGSEIARQISTALIEEGVKVLFVTHQFTFAHNFCTTSSVKSICMRAERLEDGARTFRLIEAAPLETSYGLDLFDRMIENKETAIEGISDSP